MPSVSSLPPYLLFLFLLFALSLRVCPLSNLFYSWWISVCSTNRLPGRTARVLKRSKTDRTLSELEETSWYHVYRGCKQEAVKPTGLHSQKKQKKTRETDWVTLHINCGQSRDTAALVVLCKINISCHSFWTHCPEWNNAFCAKIIAESGL